MDVDKLELGEDFPTKLEKAINDCEIMLTVISQNWLSVKDDAGNPRLDNPHDFVRREIALALAKGKRIIPILIGITPMPSKEDLPGDIKSLARRQSRRLHHDGFRSGVELLAKDLLRIINTDQRATGKAQIDSTEKPLHKHLSSGSDKESTCSAKHERRNLSALRRQIAYSLIIAVDLLFIVVTAFLSTRSWVDPYLKYYYLTVSISLSFILVVTLFQAEDSDRNRLSIFVFLLMGLIACVAVLWRYAIMLAYCQAISIKDPSKVPAPYGLSNTEDLGPYIIMISAWFILAFMTMSQCIPHPSAKNSFVILRNLVSLMFFMLICRIMWFVVEQCKWIV